jgi:glutathione S-transferase
MAIIVHGPSISTYVRTARLTLEEKGAAYRLEELNFMAGAHKEPAHLARHPFGMVPAFEHDGFALYETSAIARYVDRAFPGPKLQPAEPKALARMDQIMAVIDSYAYGALITRLVMERLVAPMVGRPADEAAIEAAKPRMKTSLGALEDLASGGDHLVGTQLTLADLYFAPIFTYVAMTPESKALLEPCSRLRAWWSAMEKRPAMAKTAPKF